MAAPATSTAVTVHQNSPNSTTYSFPDKKPYVPPVAIQSTNKVREVIRGQDMDSLLYDLLSIASPHKSDGPDKVKEVIKSFLKTHVKTAIYYTDEIGNLIVQQGRIGEHGARTMFSCHVDTVHWQPGTVTPLITNQFADEEGWIYGSTKFTTVTFHNSKDNKELTADKLPALYKELGIDDLDPRLVKVGSTADGKDVFRVSHAYPNSTGQRVTASTPVLTKTIHGPVYKANVLGADDKVGCYILCRLLKAGVPGLYVFHIGEECGGIGSKWLTKHTPDVVQDMHRCIAFDRRGTKDVIIAQSGGDCASTAFGNALAAALNQYMPPYNQYAASRMGVYTDSAEYVGLIPECTNISVGYAREHTNEERFDLVYLESTLIPALINISWESLPVVRKKEPKRSWYGYNGGRNTYYDSHYDDFDAPWDKKKAGDKGFTKPGATGPERDEDQKVLNALDKVPPVMVTKDTPLDKLPDWEPEDGLLQNASKESMVMLIAGWILRNHLTARDLATEIYDMLVDLEVAAEQLNEADYKYDD